VCRRAAAVQEATGARRDGGHNRPFAELFGVPGVVDIGCDDTVTLNT
jgi:hypothetical protein